MAERRNHRHQTPAERAADIADREAEELWRQRGPEINYNQEWLKIYDRVLQELVGDTSRHR